MVKTQVSKFLENPAVLSERLIVSVQQSFLHTETEEMQDVLPEMKGQLPSDLCPQRRSQGKEAHVLCLFCARPPGALPTPSYLCGQQPACYHRHYCWLCHTEEETIQELPSVFDLLRCSPHSPVYGT